MKKSSIDLFMALLSILIVIISIGAILWTYNLALQAFYNTDCAIKNQKTMPSVEKIDLGYNLETNQTMWKYPNETIWRVKE